MTDTLRTIARDHLPHVVRHKQSARIIAGMEAVSEAIYCSSRMMDDGVIDPADTRNVLAFCLQTVLETPHRGTQGNTFGVARL